MLPTISSVLPRGQTRYKHCTCAMLFNVHHSLLTEFSTLQMEKKSLAQNSSLANGLHSVTRLEQKIVAQEITGNSWIFLTVLKAQVISQCLEPLTFIALMSMHINLGSNVSGYLPVFLEIDSTLLKIRAPYLLNLQKKFHGRENDLDLRMLT